VYSGLEPIIVPQIKDGDGDAVRSNPDWIRHALMDEDGAFFHRKDDVLCILATTACFAPRIPDDIPSLARIAKEAGIPLVVNNAYGVQSSMIMKSIERACKSGRVDAVVQSTDKNFMVPVGGAVIASPSAASIEEMSKLYPGRASSAPVVDLMITLLAMGEKGWRELLSHRSGLLLEFKERLSNVAKEFGERILSIDENDVSIAMTLDTFDHPSAIGSALFHRNITGTRTFVAKEKLPEGGKPTSVGGFEFSEYGSHMDGYGHSYLNVACAIGLEEV
jgi:O-phospho-L-seryl-tRNASec:L-selenocysteinyl-tRNA synthase